MGLSSSQDSRGFFEKDYDFRNDMLSRGFNLEESTELFKCILSALKNPLSEEQMEWIMSERRRSTIFLGVINAQSKRL